MFRVMSDSVHETIQNVLHAARSIIQRGITDVFRVMCPDSLLQ